MAHKILSVTEKDHSYVIKVHLDETKLTRFDEPDPEYVREWTWGKEPPALPDYSADFKGDRAKPMTEQEYLSSLKEMVAEHVTAALMMMPAPEATDVPPAPGSGKGGALWHLLTSAERN